MHTGGPWSRRQPASHRCLHREAGRWRLGAHIPRGKGERQQGAGTLQVGNRPDFVRNETDADDRADLARRHGYGAAEYAAIHFAVRQEDHDKCGQADRFAATR